MMDPIFKLLRSGVIQNLHYDRLSLVVFELTEVKVKVCKIAKSGNIATDTEGASRASPQVMRVSLNS